METGVVTIQEPVSTKTNIEEAPAEVILDHSSLKVDKVNMSTVLDDEITSRDCKNSTIPGEAEFVNGSGNKETEESEREKGEAMKTILVEEDNKIVKEKASETEKDEQGFIFVHEPESFNKNIEEDAKIILSDVTLEKEDDITPKPEEVCEEIPIKTDEVKEEKDSRTVETSVNGTEVGPKATVSVEEISRNGENIVNETVPEQETTTNGESLDGVETTKRLLLEVKKEEEEKEEAEPLVKTVVEEANIVSNEETTAHESESFKENVKPVEAVKNADDSEKISSEVTVDKEKEEDIDKNTEEVQESVRVIETPTIQGEDIESKASLDHEKEIKKISKDTDEHEQELARDIPQGETFVTEAETVDTSTVQEPEILKTNINETEAYSAISGEEEGQETKENTKTSQDLKEDKEQEETEIVKTIISSDEVRSSDVEVEEFGEHIEPRSLEIKDESYGREESVEVKTKETDQEEITEEKYENLHDVASTESLKSQDNEPEASLVDITSDLAVNVDKEELKDEKINVDQVDGTQIMEEQRGFDPNEPKAEQIDQNRTDETEEIPVALPDVESVEQIQKPSLESPSEVSEETSKAIDEKIKEKPESKELGEQAHEEKTLIDLTPLQEESCLPNEQEKETKLEKHEPPNEEVSFASPSKELVEAEKVKENEEEQEADMIQKSVETVESHSSLSSSLEEKELGAVPEKIEDEKVKEEEPIVQIKSEDDTTKIHERQEDFSESVEEATVVQAEQTRDIGPTNEEVKSDEVIEDSFALPSEELEGETSVEAEKIENIKANEEEQVADKIPKSLETVESHTSLPLSSEEKEHGTVSEKIEDEKLKEEEPMVQIKSEDDTTESHERQEEVSKVVETKETTVVVAEQTRDIEPSLTEKLSMDQSQPEEHDKEACSRDEQKKEVSRNSESIVSETYALNSEEAGEEETATNGESPVHDVESTKGVLLEVEKEAEEAEIKTDAEPSLDAVEKGETETVKTVAEDAKIFNNEETTTHESESLKGDDHHEENAESVETIKNSDDADQISREVTVDKETEEDMTQKTEKVQESSMLVETPTMQGEDIESKASLELKEEVDQSSQDTKEHEQVLGRDITECENLEAEAVEAKGDTKPSLDKEVKEQEVTETAKTVIVSDEVRPSDQVDVQAEEFGEHTEPHSSEIKDESHGREESVEVKSKETVEDNNTEEKHENLLDIPSTESVKYQDNEPETSLVASTESQEKFEEIPSDLALNVDKVDETQIMEEQSGLDSNGAEAEQVDQNRADETEESQVAKLVVLPDVEEPVEQMQKPSLESPSEVSEERSKTVDEKIEEEITLHREGQDEGSFGLETVSVPVSKELEERTLIDLTPLQVESSQPNEQDKETILEKHETTNEEVSSESFKGDDNKGENAESVEAIKISDDAEQISSEVTGDREKEDDHHEENAELVEAIKNSDDAEQISHEVTVDREMEEDMTKKTEELQESSTVIETLTTQGEEIESKASLELKEEVDQSSKDTEEHEHVLGREIPQCENIEAEPVEAKEDTKPILDKEDKEQELKETAKIVIFSDEVRPSDQVDVQADEFGEHTEPCSSEIKDESHGREESVEEIVQDESTEEKHENILDVPTIESEKFQDNEPETSLVANKEIGEKFEETPSDLVLSIDKEELKDEKIDVDQVDGTQIMEDQRGLDSNVAEAEHIDRNRTYETEESPVVNLVVLPDVESVEQIQKPSLESPSEVIEETSKTIDENIEEKSEEETVSVPEESSKPNEQDKETVLEKHEPTNEEVSSESFKGDDNKGENEESVEAIKTSEDAEQISCEVTGDIEEEEDITQKVEKVQESPLVIETPREDIELEEEVDQSSKDIEEHENVLGRDILQCETIEAEAVDTTTVQEAVILKTLETNISETEAVHSAIDEAEEIQETKEDTEVKDESQGREESVEVKSKETVQDESSEENDVNLLDVRSGELEKGQENEPETTLVSKIESQEKSEEIPSDLALKDELKDEKTKADQVDETQTMEVQRGLDLNEPEAEQNDQNRTDETEETPVSKLVVVEDSGLDETTHNQTLLDVESTEKMQKPSLETPSGILEETSKTVDEKIEDKLKEEVVLHQEGQEEGSYGLETKEETVSVPEESCLPIEQENETKFQEKNEPTKEEVSNDQQIPADETSDEVIQVSSASDETVVQAEKIEGESVDEEDKKAEKIQKILETDEIVEPHSSFQEHATVSEKIDEEKVEDVEPVGDMSEKGLEITETTDLSISSIDQNKDIKASDEEIQIPSVALPLDEQEKVTSTEKEETKENETVEANKEDEEITVSTSTTSENVCIQQEEFVKLEAPKLEESKEEKSQEIVETTKAIEEKDQAPKLVEEIHEEETEEAHKIQAEEILPTEIIPRESSDEALVSMLASKEDDQVTLQEGKCADDVTETKDTQEERSVSVETEESVEETKPKEPKDDHVETPTSPIISEKNDNETLIAEEKKGDEDINETETTMSLEESKEILETTEAKEATGDQTLPIETSQEDQTLSSELVSRVDDQTPRHVEEIHEEETKEECKFEAIVDQSLSVETSQEYQTPSSDLASELDDQTPKQVDEEETKEEHKLQVEVDEEETKDEHLQVEVDQILPVETSQEDQTPSLVKDIIEEETKETHKVQAEDTVPRESFSEAPVSVLASGEDEPVTPQESNYAGDDTHEERHVSAETEESVEDTKPKEPEVEETKKSDDQVETSTKLTEVEDENTKKTDTEVAELTDYSTVEAEQEDENSSNLPVVEILKGLHQFPSETERKINESTSSGEKVIIEPAEQEQKKGDVVVESNEKDSASDIIEEVKVQDGRSREFEVNVEEKLQEESRVIAESKEEVPADLSLTELLPIVKILSAEKQEESESQQDVDSSISEKISLQEEQKEKKAETHETVKEEDEIVENKEEKKSEDEQVEKLWDSSATRDIEEIFSSEVKEEKQDLGKEEASHSVLGSEEEINEVVTSEKQITDPAGVIMKASEAEHESNEEHIETQARSDDTKSNDDRDLTTEQAPKNQEYEVSVDKSFTKEALSEQLQVPSSTVLDDIQEKSEQEPVADLADRDLSVQKPSELIQLEEKVEVKKAGDDKNEETRDALITKENLQVQDQPNDLEASVTDKETSEQEQSNDLEEDIGTNVKLEVHDDEVRCDSHDSVAESKEVEHVETELEDAIKHGVSVEEKNNASEKIDREAAKEISQEESKQTNTVKEEITEEEKETNQECLKKTDDVIDLTQTETRDLESLSSVSKTQDKPQQKDEIPIQKTREIADDVPKIAEEVQQKDEESELFSEVKESEPTEKESARESLSNLVQNVKGTTKNEDTTTEPHIEEKLKTEEEESEDEHNKDDKTSPDSLVMVEAKDTVSIIKTHKKSQGILSGVGSKVKHSISKVKKVLTGKSSHTTTKPSSPK